MTAATGKIDTSTEDRGSVDLKVEPARGLRLMLVEDDEADAFIVQELLDEVPDRLSLTWARSMAEAATAIADADCVLLDLGLPDSLGLDALRRLHEIAGPIPVIVLTGQNSETVGEAAVAAGAQDFLSKGAVTSQLLMRTIRYAVQRRRAEDAEAALLEERLHAAENIRLERGLLPHPVLAADTDIEVSTRYRPGGGRMLLGGDFYDVVTDDSGAVHVVIGDVCGHGPDQAALGVALRIAWRTLVLSGTPDDELLSVVHRVLVNERHDPSLFATVCTLTLDSTRRTARLCIAGHPAPMLRGAEGWTSLPQVGGPALGLIDSARWRSHRIDLPHQPWQLLFYTDGAIEGLIGAGHDRLGPDGLRNLINNRLDTHQPRSDRASLLDEILGEVTTLNGGPLTDDVALLLLTRDTDTPGSSTP